MENNCHCGGCDCGEKEKELTSTEKKVENLIQDIKDLGYDVEKTQEGEYKIF